MRIEIQRAANLGLLHTVLGIAPDTRVSVGDMKSNSIEIWDLATGNYYTGFPFASPPIVHKTYLAIPQWVVELTLTSTEKLLQEWRTSEGASERRMAIFTELDYRGVQAR